MKTNLAYIETASEAAVAQEMTAPTISISAQAEVARARTVIVGGFSVDDESAGLQRLESVLQSRKTALRDYRVDRDKVIAELKAIDVTPLAVVPKAAWERICAASGLICLSPDTEGRVRVSKHILRDMEKYAEKVTTCLYVILGVIAGPCFGVFCYSYWDWPLWGCALTSIAMGCVVCLIAGGLAGELKEDFDRSPGWVRKIFVRARIKSFVKKPWETIIGELFDLEGVSEDQIFKTQVVLPEPPADVSATLIKARRLTLKVAAVPDAISFAEAPGTIVRRQFEADVKVREDRERVRRAFERDPIVYHEHRSAVAIIAQFGDFPIEQQVVDQVVNSEHLL